MKAPKYNVGDIVKFQFVDEIKEGSVFIVDRYGTFEQNEEPSYDIMIDSENCLYKHIRESIHSAL